MRVTSGQFNLGLIPRVWVSLGFLTALLMGSLVGCNVFTPLASDNTRDLDYDGLVLRGNDALNHGNYADAMELYVRAQQKNPEGSEAYLFHAKAIMALYHLDYARLNGEFDKKQAAGAHGLPFVDSTDNVENIDSIYYPIATAVNDLEHILREAKDTIRFSARNVLLPDGDTASDGKVSASVAQLDLGLLQTLKGMLAALDLDGNRRINRKCGISDCDPSNPNATCPAVPHADSLCREGAESEVKRLKSFQQLTKNIRLDSLDSRDTKARDVSTNPNDINGFLDAMEGPLSGAGYNLDSVSGSLQSHHEAQLSNELGDVVGNVRDMGAFLGYMRYNDMQDNDYDAQTGLDAPKGRMVWHDFDKDGGIRWDYADSAASGYPAESYNLGYPLHRYLHPELYLTRAELEANYPALKKDTSQNSRIALMIKHCRDIVTKLPIAGKVTADLKEKLLAVTCSTITTVIRPGVKPPKDRSDWVSGPFGIDEEMIDERDNDYDGLRDEDGRNAVGMDDDDDAALTTDLLGQEIKPMVWSDDADHQNACPDIDTNIPMPAKPLQKQFCIGALENRIYLARHGGRDSLLVYYSPVLSEGPASNCLDDYEKLPADYKAVFKPTESEVREACRFKHIWIAPRPPRSEWKSGILGIDEEILDGVDNDGDGWIDEDVKAVLP